MVQCLRFHWDKMLLWMLHEYFIFFTRNDADEWWEEEEHGTQRRCWTWKLSVGAKKCIAYLHNNWTHKSLIDGCKSRRIASSGGSLSSWRLSSGSCTEMVLIEGKQFVEKKFRVCLWITTTNIHEMPDFWWSARFEIPKVRRLTKESTNKVFTHRRVIHDRRRQSADENRSKSVENSGKIAKTLNRWLGTLTFAVAA